jgi:cytidylate kinase
MKLTTENSKNSLFYENKDITTLLYSKNIDSKVSEVSKKSIVRNNLVDFQRNLAIEGNIVMVGRDISTVVLPNSNLKIFLRAGLDIRAIRRAKEISSIDINIIKKSILIRDQIDSTRKLSPLKIAKESFVIDTDELDLVGVVSEIKKLYEKIND